MNILVRLSLVGMLGLLAPWSVTAAHPSGHGTMVAAQALGASAAFAGDGRLWLVTAHDGHVWLRHSDDFGKHLSKPVAVNKKAEPVSAEGENRPKIALGARGEIYVTWTRPLAKPYTGSIRFARSLDGGKTFSVPITVHHDRAVITHRFDSLAVDGKGRILVAWIDKRDLEAAKARHQPYLGAAVYYAWSDDRGASFEKEKKLADQSCECCRIAIARTAGGKVAVFWRAVYGDNIRDHAFAILEHGKTPVPARATFTGWHIAGCPHHGPGLAMAADGTAHGVWFSAKDDRPTIWYGQIDPGKPPRHLRKLAGAGAAHADIAVHGQTVWTVWNQMAADGTALMLHVSHDGGTRFLPPRAIGHTAGQAGSPQLLQWKGKAYVAWNTAAGFQLVQVEAAP